MQMSENPRSPSIVLQLWRHQVTWRRSANRKQFKLTILLIILVERNANMTNVVDLSLTVTSSIRLGKLEMITRRLSASSLAHFHGLFTWFLQSDRSGHRNDLTRFGVKMDAESPPAADNLINYTSIKL